MLLVIAGARHPHRGKVAVGAEFVTQRSRDYGPSGACRVISRYLDYIFLAAMVLICIVSGGYDVPKGLRSEARSDGGEPARGFRWS